jgi:hypothetical protein
MHLYTDDIGNNANIKKCIELMQSRYPRLRIGSLGDISTTFSSCKVYIGQLSPQNLENILKGFSASQRAIIIEENCIKNIKNFHEILREEHTLTLIQSTSSTYEHDTTKMLIDFLKKKQNYSQTLLDDFSTIHREIETNATIHGNLETSLPPIYDSKSLQKTFEKINEKLKDPEYAFKKITTRINCIAGKVSFSIQDQGKGFKFDTFLEKYQHSGGLFKGTDLVLMLSDSLEYDFEKRLFNVSLSERSAEADIEETRELKVGVFCPPKKMSSLKKALSEKQLIKASFTHLAQKNAADKTLSEQQDIILILGGIGASKALGICKKIRKNFDLLDLPILFQKEADDLKPLASEITPLTNAYLSSPLNANELINKIHLHCDMIELKKEFTRYYGHYSSEIEMAKMSIKRLEKSKVILQPFSNEKKCATAIISGSETPFSLQDRLHTLSSTTEKYYAQGFLINAKKCNNLFYTSINETGLSALLVMAKIKATIEAFPGTQYDDPLEILTHIKDTLHCITPSEMKFTLACFTLNKEEKTLQCATYGSLSFILDSQRTFSAPEKTKSPEKEISSFCFNLNEEKQILAFDDNFSPSQEEINLLRNQLKTTSLLSLEMPYTDKAPSIYNLKSEKIPYFSLKVETFDESKLGELL